MIGATRKLKLMITGGKRKDEKEEKKKNDGVSDVKMNAR